MIIELEKTLKISGTRIHVKFFQPIFKLLEKNITIFCLHGITVGSQTFSDFGRFAAELGYQVVAFDQYGRGKSDHVNEKYCDQLIVDQFFLVLKAIEVFINKRIIFVSVSNSIFMLLKILPQLKEPQYSQYVVLRIISFSPTIPNALQVISDFQGVMPSKPPQMALLLSFPVFRWLIFWGMITSGYFQSMILEFVLLSYNNPNSFLAKENVHIVQKSISNHPGFLQAVLSTLCYSECLRNPYHCRQRYQDLGKLLTETGVRCLVIWGTQDAVTPFEYHKPMMEWLGPQAELLVVQGANHGELLSEWEDEYWQVVTRGVRRFLDPSLEFDSSISISIIQSSTLFPESAICPSSPSFSLVLPDQLPSPTTSQEKDLQERSDILQDALISRSLLRPYRPHLRRNVEVEFESQSLPSNQHQYQQQSLSQSLSQSQSQSRHESESPSQSTIACQGGKPSSLFSPCLETNILYLSLPHQSLYPSPSPQLLSFSPESSLFFENQLNLFRRFYLLEHNNNKEQFPHPHDISSPSLSSPSPDPSPSNLVRQSGQPSSLFRSFVHYLHAYSPTSTSHSSHISIWPQEDRLSLPSLPSIPSLSSLSSEDSYLSDLTDVFSVASGSSRGDGEVAGATDVDLPMLATLSREITLSLKF